MIHHNIYIALNDIYIYIYVYIYIRIYINQCDPIKRIISFLTLDPGMAPGWWSCSLEIWSSGGRPNQSWWKPISGNCSWSWRSIPYQTWCGTHFSHWFWCWPMCKYDRCCVWKGNSVPMPTSMNGCIQLTLHSNYFATQLIATLPVMCGPKKIWEWHRV